MTEQEIKIELDMIPIKLEKARKVIVAMTEYPEVAQYLLDEIETLVRSENILCAMLYN